MSEVKRYEMIGQGDCEMSLIGSATEQGPCDGQYMLATDYDALAARLAGAMLELREVSARNIVLESDVLKAEARVRELEHALRRASERLSWLRDHHCSSEFARGQAKMAADECWRVQAGERATASAGGGQ